MAFPFKRILAPVDFDPSSLKGLEIAAKIAREHGGDISLANREGGGLRLTIIVPRFHGAQPLPRQATFLGPGVGTTGTVATSPIASPASSRP